MLRLAVLLLLYVSDVLGQGQQILVNVTQGQMLGSMMLSRGGSRFYAFRGIPYAKPPVGELRFKDPVYLDRWQGVLDATRDAPDCIQKNYFLADPTISGQEDCLFLNVYTPQLQTSRNTSLLPVMVYIFGGGWFCGSANQATIGPEYILDGGVLLVTMNYRLGALGFLSTGCDASPGNYGFKDQALALRWVRNNIATLGGDPERVTIFGESAGSGSVHLHMLSPLSKGLFQRAISQSGVALNPWSRPYKEPIDIARKQAIFLGAPAASWSSGKIMHWLRYNVSANDITDAGDGFKFWSVDPLITFGPVVEKQTIHNANPFLTETPLEAVQTMGGNRVPWMVGVVSNEGVVRGGAILSNASLLEDFNKYNDVLGPKILDLGEGSMANETWAKIRHHFLGNGGHVTQDNGQNFIDIYSDRSFNHGTHKAIFMHSRRSTHPIYVYRMNYKGKYSYAPVFTHALTDFGVSHVDDLIYLFQTQGLFPEWPEDHPDIEMSKFIVKLWTNFARTGNPNSHGHATWSPALDKNVPLENQEIRYLEISGPYGSNSIKKQSSDESYKNTNSKKKRDNDNLPFQLRMMSGFYKERMKFWDSLSLEENKLFNNSINSKP